MRNALIHGYDVTDYPIVWRAIRESAPALRTQIEALLAEIDRDESEEAGSS